MSKHVPDIFVDTQGCSGSLFFTKHIAGCPEVYCYVHYPTVKKDMKPRGEAKITSLTVAFKEKFYYPFCAWLYKHEGQSCDAAMVNGNWTKKHIENVWERRVTVLFPPVAVSKFADLPLGFNKRKPWILSIGQFRQEKDHPKMIKAFAKYKSKNPSDTTSRLVLLGGCRDSSDEDRVENFKQLAKGLKVEDSVDFIINAPHEDKKKYLGECTIGIHTMWKEHFGICVVEYMAGGLITIAHNTGGPKRDIIRPFEDNPTGYLAETVDEYASTIETVLQELRTNPDNPKKIQKSARASADARFSEEAFIGGVKSFFVSNSKKIAKLMKD
jgi:alpha-1,2-mannosyltransferase